MRFRRRPQAVPRCTWSWGTAARNRSMLSACQAQGSEWRATQERVHGLHRVGAMEARRACVGGHGGAGAGLPRTSSICRTCPVPLSRYAASAPRARNSSSTCVPRQPDLPTRRVVPGRAHAGSVSGAGVRRAPRVLLRRPRARSNSAPSGSAAAAAPALGCLDCLPCLLGGSAALALPRGILRGQQMRCSRARGGAGRAGATVPASPDRREQQQPLEAKRLSLRLRGAAAGR